MPGRTRVRGQGLAHVHGPALRMVQRSGLLAKVGPDHVFQATPAAVAWAQSVSEQHDQEQRATPATTDPPGETGRGMT